LSGGAHLNPAKNIFDFRVRFFPVFALLGASVIGASLKTPGTRR
jgi:hypothetical protein